MAKNVFWAFYSKNQDLVAAGHTCQHMVTSEVALITSGNILLHLATNWSHLATFCSNPGTTYFVTYNAVHKWQLIFNPGNNSSHLATPGHILQCSGNIWQHVGTTGNQLVTSGKFLVKFRKLTVLLKISCYSQLATHSYPC